MKKHSLFTRAVFAGLLALSLYSVPASAEDLFSDKAGLTLVDSVSVIPVADITPALYQQIGENVYVPINEQYFVNQFLISGFTYLPFQGGSPANFPPTFTIYDTTNNILTQTANLPATPSVGVLQTSVSPCAHQPFIAVSTFFPTDISLTTWDYILNIYQYNPENGQLVSPNPVYSLDFLAWNPNITNTITYNTGVTFSSDGKYLFFSYTLGSRTFPQSITGQVFGVFAVGSDGSLNPTPVATFSLPNAPDSGVFVPNEIKSFVKKSHKDHDSKIYKLIVGLLGFTPGNISGGNVQAGYIQSYDFDPSKGTLSQTGSQPLPCHLEGFDINPHHDRVVTCGFSATNGPTVVQPVAVANPNYFTPFPLGEPQPNDNLRLYKYNQNAHKNALSFISGHNIGAFAWNARWSHGGHKLALSSSPLIENFGLLQPPVVCTPALPPYDFSPWVISTFTFDHHKDKLSLQDTQPGAPSSVNLAWSADDKILGVSGQPTPFQQNFQLYEVGEQ